MSKILDNCLSSLHSSFISGDGKVTQCCKKRRFTFSLSYYCHIMVKSVQSALSDLLTTSATHGTFSRPITKRGPILIGLELNTNAREPFEHS